MKNVKDILVNHVLPFALTVGAVYVGIAIAAKYPISKIINVGGNVANPAAPATK